MLFDTHAHVHGDEFDADREAVLQRASQAGVETIVTVGIDLDSSRAAVALASAPSIAGVRIHAAVGFHPYEGDTVDAAAIEALRGLAADPCVVAIGETGLDFFRGKGSREGQERALRMQLDLAVERDLAAILHVRSSDVAGQKGASDAYDAVIRILDDGYVGKVRAVSHCFSGTPAHALALAERGLFVSFAGNSTYPKAQALRDAAAVVPLDRIVVETDCPYLSPQKFRGKRNEPAYVRDTAVGIAQVKGLSLSEFASAATANARRLFAL